MARIKNVTDDVLDVPSLGLFAVQPGDIVEVPRAADFADSEMWQVTATGKAKKAHKPQDDQHDPTPAEPDTADEENAQ